jgi:hypothetical protein
MDSSRQNQAIRMTGSASGLYLSLNGSLFDG